MKRRKVELGKRGKTGKKEQFYIFMFRIETCRNSVRENRDTDILNKPMIEHLSGTSKKEEFPVLTGFQKKFSGFS